MTSPQIILQADDLKASVADTSSGSNEAWVARQALQDLYQKLLVMDLEFALDKKVEQDLWNHAFKNQITVLQNQAKDKQNPKRSEIQSSLNLFLETAGGFYLQLLQELCSAFKLDLPFRRKASNFGVLKEYGALNPKMRVPKPSSSMYICQHCLVHLGDIARYRQQIDQAQSYYRHAAHLVPYNGQPYNQLAILEAAKSNKLATVFYYARSIAVKHPFPVASTNLDKFYTKISKETYDYRGKLSLTETIATFLQFHAFIHLDSDSDKARKHGERLIQSLPTHVTSTSFSSYQLVQMIAINLFAIHKAQRGQKDDENDNNPHSTDNKDNKDQLDVVCDTEVGRAFTIVFDLTMSMLEQLVYNTPKQEQKAKDYHTLPALKVILDWLLSDTRVMEHTASTNSSIWANLSKLLNNLQFHGGQKDVTFDPDKYVTAPLPEDCDLQCFLPVLKAHAHLDLSKVTSDATSGETELRLRCHRLVDHGQRIADDFSRLSLLTYTRLKSGRLQFSCPLGQVKILSGPDTERKISRQNNVAIQAIMQKKDNVQLALKDLSPDQTVRPGGTTPTRRLSTEDHRGDSNMMSHGEARKQAMQQHSQYTQPQQQYTQYPQYQQGYTPYQPLSYQQQQQGHSGGLGIGMNGVEPPQQQATVATRDTHSPGSLPQMGHLHPGSGGQYGPLSGKGGSQQGMPGARRSMGHQQGAGMVGYGMTNGGSPRSSLDLTSVPGPPQKPSFQQAPGSGLSPGSQPGMVPGGPFSSSPGGVTPVPVGHHQGMVNQPQPHSTVAPTRSTMHSFPQSQSFPQSFPQNYPQNYLPPGSQQYCGDSSSRPPQQQFGNPDPSSRGVNMGGFPSSSPPDGIHTSPAYGSSFPAARAPSPQITQSLNTAPASILNLLNSGNLGIYAPSPTRMSSQQPVGGPLDRYLRLGEEVEAGRGGFPAGGVSSGRFPRGVSSDHISEPGLMLQREDFNKDEPELKFTDLVLEPDSPFSPSSGLGLSGLTINNQTRMPQSDSPVNGPLGSLFSMPADGGLGSQANTYSLFSKSPWTVQLSKPDPNKSLSSSPFGSGEDSGSVRNTPDPFGDMADVQNLSTGFPLGYAFGVPDSNWTNQPAPPRPDDSAKSNTLLSSSIQSLWSPGPSPLEKLLEQQKQQQRHCDPH